MELGLNFGDEDLEASTAPAAKSPGQEDYRVKTCPPKWFQELDGGDLSDEDLQARLKFSADLAYAGGDFGSARDLYGRHLAGLGSRRAASVRRDVTEGLARSCLRLGSLGEAARWAEELHATSSPTNPDHLTVSSCLLAEVARAAGDADAELAHLASAVRHHPFAPELWFRAGEAYQRRLSGEGAPVLGRVDLGREAACFCFVRAFVLLRTVENSVRSFARRSNEAARGRSKAAVDRLGLPLDVVDRIELFASLDVFNRDQSDSCRDPAAAAGDFEDLGRSVRQRAIEESFREGGDRARFDEGWAKGAVAEFERRWLTFLVE